MEAGQLTTPNPTQNTPSEAAQRFYLCLADRDERESIERLRRHRQLAADIEDAARRADAVQRLELALSRRSNAA
jgi:hypothetical protein